MADDERDGPSLELPSFGFKRRKSRREQLEEQPTVVEPSAAQPPPPAPELPPAESETPVEVTSAEPRPLFADEAQQHAVDPERAQSDLTERLTAVAAAEPESVTTAGGERKKDAAPREPRESGAMPFALLTGLLVGLLTVGITWATLRGCEAIRGTSSCGGGPGLLVLVAMLVLLVLVGAGLLRVMRVPDPGSTSFLAVGLVAVISLLFLVDLLLNWWMIIVIPLLSTATFALAHWVTTSFVEAPRDQMR